VVLLGYWKAAKAFFLGAKFWVYLGAALLIAAVSFHQGKESCQEKAYQALEREIEKIEDRAAKAVKQAAKDARTLHEAKEKGNDLVEEAEAMDSGSCNLVDDELLHLQRVQERTSVK
jgi:hypothetical protein